MVLFEMLDMVTSCAIVTLSLRRAVLTIFDFRKCRDLEIRVRGHSRSLKVVPFDGLHNRVRGPSSHWKCRHVIERIRLPIDVL